MEEACHLQNSCISDVKHPICDPEPNRKRKLVQYELGNSSLLWPKHKIRDRCSSSAQGSSIIQCHEKEKLTEELTKSDEICDELEQDSNYDSNSFIETNVNSKAFDVKGKAVDLPIQPSHVDQPSTSSNGSIGGVYRSTLYSLESRNISEASTQTNTNTGDGLQAGQGYPAFGRKYPTMVPDHESGSSKYGMEVDDTADDDLMLYSNDVAPNALVLSSGSWSPKEDARLGTRKPTIDQEFEQYFSMLML